MSGLAVVNYSFALHALHLLQPQLVNNSHSHLSSEAIFFMYGPFPERTVLEMVPTFCLDFATLMLGWSGSDREYPEQVDS